MLSHCFWDDLVYGRPLSGKKETSYLLRKWVVMNFIYFCKKYCNLIASSILKSKAKAALCHLYNRRKKVSSHGYQTLIFMDGQNQGVYQNLIFYVIFKGSAFRNILKVSKFQNDFINSFWNLLTFSFHNVIVVKFKSSNIVWRS